MLDVLAFSSLWVAAAAAALAAACSLAMGVPVAGAAVGLAFAGTLVVYNVDRLRDLDADRATAPDRSAFVARHGGGLALLTIAAALASLGFALAAGPRAFAVLVPILGLGLLHRRLKHLGFGKPAYLATAWIGVVVGVPALIDPAATHVAWTLGITGPALFANAVASNIRNVEVAASRFGPRPAQGVARACAVLGVVVAATAPVPARSLLAVPAATLLALLLFRPGERYGLLIVDGALLAGAIVAGGVALR
jgi:4-hydroxybenzoate polyprenyltransferase